MAEELCSDCNLGHMGAAWLESLRVDAGDSSDQELIADQPNAELLQAALELPRPGRCRELRKILPSPQRKGPNLHPFDRCPEIGLLALLYGGQPPELFDRD